MIEVQHVKKKFGKRIVLQDISFQVKPGERVVIVGRNGCGKSTLLQILAGAVRPDGGELVYFGKQPLKDSRVFRKYCGYVPQDNPLMEELSVLDNLRLWGYHKRHPDPVILEQFGLEEMLHRKVELLSGGMKRRVSFACATIVHPPLLLLDEPTTALDICYRNEIRQWMDHYQQNGGMIIMTTHEESEIIQAQYCFVMRDGELVKITDAQRNMESILNMTEEENERNV